MASGVQTYPVRVEGRLRHRRATEGLAETYRATLWRHPDADALSAA
jgi:hypothetical protein